MMTMEQFEEEKTRLVTLYGGTARDASARRDQELARLYVRSRWSQRQLADVEHKSQADIDRRLRFGRFLDVTPNRSQDGLTEWAFRSYWSQTNKEEDEKTRFATVQARMERTPTAQPIPKGLGKKLIAQFNDGKYHRISDMATALNVDMPTIRGICDRIVSHGTFQTFGERRPASPKDGSYAYRFVKGGKKKIDLAVFRSEVQPVLDDMQMVISGPRKSDFTREAMQTAFAQLLKVLDSIAR